MMVVVMVLSHNAINFDASVTTSVVAAVAVTTSSSYLMLLLFSPDTAVCVAAASADVVTCVAYRYTFYGCFSH